MIYGANGYCGRWLAREAMRRGLNPVLAGRDAAAILNLATELKLQWRSFDLANPGTVAHALGEIDAVVNCAGPFLRTGEKMIAGCLAARTHYIDITGEIDVFAAAERRHAEAVAAQIVLCPGAGFDIVPTDCVAAVLKEALPDADHLAIGFDASREMSPGSASTIVESLKLGCRVRRAGEIVDVPFGYRRRRIDFGEGEAGAVIIAWGDVATAYFSTGIPNIEVYLRVPAADFAVAAALNLLLPLLKWPAVERALGRLARRAKGPSERQVREGRCLIWGEVRNSAGETRTARLVTPDAYRLTIDAVFMTLAHLLEQSPAPGYYTPSRLMGARCVERLPGVGRITLA